MKRTYFTFKRFVIHHDLAAMKVSTDACLLGALAQFSSPTTILDIGAGTGLLSFMLAQKYPHAAIWAVENEPGAIQQLQINRQLNPEFDQISVYPQAIQDLPQQAPKFDGIICNPPYYTKHLTSPDASRTQAHHQETLTADTLVTCIDTHLDAQGTAWVVYPPHEMNKFIPLAADKNWYPSQWFGTSHSPDHAITREYVALQKGDPKPRIREDFPIHQVDGQYHPTFKELLKEYYIIF